MKEKFLTALLAALCLISSFQVNYTYALNETLSKSTSLSFIKIFPIIHAERSLGYSGVSIGIRINSSLIYKGNMILYAKSSLKYAEKGKTSILQVEVSNFISSVKLTADVSISISYGVGSIDVPVKVMNLEYSMLDTMGAAHEAILGEYLLFSGTIPIIGVQVSLFMRPIIEYTPTLYGSLDINGAATASPSSLRWNQKSVATSIHFTDTQPILISLANPNLTLNDLKVNLEIYAIITAASISASDIELVNLGDYSISSSPVNLISFEPNYYVLYTKLRESYFELASRLQEIRQSLATLTKEVSNLRTTLTQQISNLNEKVDLLNSQIETYATKLENLTAKYNEMEGSLISLTSRVTSIESQVNQLVAQPRNQQFQLDILTFLSIGALLAAVSSLILILRKIK